MNDDATPVDDLDRRLLERLRTDGREGNRSLARGLNVSEATIASHLRRLESGGMMRVVALTDIEAFGYEHMAFVLITVTGRPVPEVAREIAAVPETLSVTIATGRFHIIATLLARDRQQLGRIVGELIPRVPGVAAARCEVAVDFARYDSKWSVLRAMDGTSPAPPLRPADIDRLDLAIIESLQHDARSSNRRIAANLNVSEGTVRARIGRLVQEQRIRIQAISDIQVFGLRSHAVVGIRVDDGKVAEARHGLLEISELEVLIQTVGEFTFMGVVVGTSREDLLETVLGRIHSLAHVAGTETWESVATLKHAYTWARLVDVERASAAA